MDKTALKKLLKDIYEKRVTPQKALSLLKNMPYEDVGFAHIDHHRNIRKGFPEVIYCEGKTTCQIVRIVEKILESGCDILATRANPEVYRQVKRLDKRTTYNEDARTVTIKQKDKKLKGKILISTAGTSDIPVAEEAKVTAEMLGSLVYTIYDVGVSGIHRLLDKKEDFFSANVVIVVAGMDGAMASVVGGLVDKPVIAVPTSVGYGANFHGISALLTMLNSCASGVGVVNIDNGFGAGFLAHKINII